LAKKRASGLQADADAKSLIKQVEYLNVFAEIHILYE